MNHIYRVIFDRRLGRFRVASELAKSRGKDGGTTMKVGALPALALFAALQFGGGAAWAACAPAVPTDGATVSCTGVPILLPPNPNSFQSKANDLDLTVQAGAIMSTLPGGTAMTLGGTGITLTNLGAIP